MRSQSIFQPISAAFFSLILLLGCQKGSRTEVTPFGTTVGDEAAAIPTASNDFTLADIMANGELIMLTLSGPETYFDYHGRGMGTQYLLCENFAHSIGVSLRVELCQDTAEMVRK
ncbi:MAG: tail length tape measure protein, partial [Prevotella sp.]|nr:tail length tape measure protein [Prevotella sp.]